MLLPADVVQVDRDGSSPTGHGPHEGRLDPTQVLALEVDAVLLPLALQLDAVEFLDRGLVSLGHAAFLGIGGYVVGILFYHSSEAEPFLGFLAGSENGLIVWPAAVLTATLFAGIIGALSLRTSGMHFIMITLAFAQMTYFFSIGLEKYGGDDGLSLYARNQFPGLDLGQDQQFYYVCLFCLAAFLFFAYRLVHSRYGLVLRGASSSPRRIQALGINGFRYKLVCFMIGGGGAGAGWQAASTRNRTVRRAKTTNHLCLFISLLLW